MNSASVLTIVAEARRRFDQRNSTTFNDSIELIPWTRDSLKQIYEIVTQAWRDWYTVRRPMSLSGGVERYSLPSDVRALVGVYMVYNNGVTGQPGAYKELLHEMPRSDWGRYGTSNIWRRWPMLYRMQNKDLYFTPVPSIDYVNAIELQYVPQWRGPLLDWTPIDDVLPNGWEEWVVLDVAIKMAVKLKMDTDAFLQQKMEIQKRIVQGAASRTAEPPKKRDIYSYSRYTWYNGTPGGPATWAI